MNPRNTMQALLEGRACADVALPFRLLLGQRNATAHTSRCCTNHTWMLSLAFCWNLTAISMQSAEAPPLVMNISRTRGCPTGWSCCSGAFASLRIRSWMAPGIFSVSLSNHNTLLFTLFIFPGTPPCNISTRLCHKHSDFNLRHPVPS